MKICGLVQRSICFLGRRFLFKHLYFDLRLDIGFPLFTFLFELSNNLSEFSHCPQLQVDAFLRVGLDNELLELGWTVILIDNFLEQVTLLCACILSHFVKSDINNNPKNSNLAILALKQPSALKLWHWGKRVRI